MILVSSSLEGFWKTVSFSMLKCQVLRYLFREASERRFTDMLTDKVFFIIFKMYKFWDSYENLHNAICSYFMPYTQQCKDDRTNTLENFK